MTTVILAKTYADAAEVAGRGGLGRDWLYPHDATLLHGMVIQRVVYVEGWLHSTTITTETAEEVQRRLAPDAVVLMAPRALLDAQAAPAPVSAPFVETATQDSPDTSQARRRRPPAPIVVILAVSLGGGVAGALLAILGRAWGWWA